MPQLSPDLLDQLCSLVAQLREESAGFEENHADAQLWYNRGYANGILRGLQRLLAQESPCGQALDDEFLLQGHEVMAWGKAYRHGERTGEQETYEISGMK